MRKVLGALFFLVTLPVTLAFLVAGTVLTVSGLLLARVAEAIMDTRHIIEGEK
jgi:Flp pilus assembly protein protease CpaA